MKNYLCFLVMVLLSTWASTARAMLLDYKSTVITPEEVLGITDHFTSSETIAISTSVGSDYYFYNDFKSMVSEIVRDILDNQPFPSQTFKPLNGTMTNPIPEPPAIMLLGFGLISLAIVGRKQFKK